MPPSIYNDPFSRHRRFFFIKAMIWKKVKYFNSCEGLCTKSKGITIMPLRSANKTAKALRSILSEGIKIEILPEKQLPSFETKKRK